jgi:hypothetical protein
MTQPLFHSRTNSLHSGMPWALRMAADAGNSVARLTLPCGLWMINLWKRVVSSLIIPWVVAI